WAPVPAFGALEHGRIGAVVHAFGLANHPKYRIRGKPLGSRCCKKRRRNSLTSESHRAFFAVICIILPTEADFGFGDGDNPMVGDGHTMGVTSQVLQDMVWPAKRRLRIHDPILLKQRSQESAEVVFIRQRQTLAEEGELSLAES